MKYKLLKDYKTLKAGTIFEEPEGQYKPNPVVSFIESKDSVFVVPIKYCKKRTDLFMEL